MTSTYPPTLYDGPTEVHKYAIAGQVLSFAGVRELA